MRRSHRRVGFAVQKSIGKRSAIRLFVAIALSTTLLPAPLAQAAVVSFNCPTGGGTYQVDSGSVIGSTGTCTGDSTTVVATGTFMEDVRAIQVNGVALSLGSWKQTATTLTFAVTPSIAGVYSIQIFNGSAPVLAPQTLTVSAAPTAPKPVSLKRSRYIYLHCVNGPKKRIVYGTNPACPVGYSKQ